MNAHSAKPWGSARPVATDTAADGDYNYTASGESRKIALSEETPRRICGRIDTGAGIGMVAALPHPTSTATGATAAEPHDGADNACGAKNFQPRRAEL